MPLKNLLQRLLPSRPRSEAPKPEPTDWSLAQAVNHETGETGILRTRTCKPRRADLESLTTAVVITWPYQSPNGMPPSEINQQQLHFERALDPLSADHENSELVQVFTGMGQKEWTFYARSREAFMADLNRLLGGHPRYPLAINFYEDPAWQIWGENRETLGR